MIEIIYHFDFSKLFSNPAQTAAGGVLAILLIGIFWTDAISYDSYLPNEKNFNYASINAYLDDLDYGLPYRNVTSYGWKYLDYGNYADENMKLTDYAKSSPSRSTVWKRRSCRGRRRSKEIRLPSMMTARE